VANNLNKAITAVVLGLSLSQVLAADHGIEMPKMERANPPTTTQPFAEKRFWYATHLSPAELTERVSLGDADALLTAGDLGRKDLISELKRHAAGGGLQQIYATMALAKLGNRTIFRKYLSQTQTGSREDRYDGILALTYIGSREAVPAIAPLLDERVVSKVEGDQSQIPLPTAAAQALENILPEVVAAFRKDGKSPSIENWMIWWEKNKKNFGTKPPNHSLDRPAAR
jgi:hypothetical protein